MFLFLLLILESFAFTTYYNPPSSSSIIFQPYISENSTHILLQSSAIRKIDEYSYMFVTACYKYCSKELFYYKLVYDNKLCDFNVYLILKEDYENTQLYDYEINIGTFVGTLLRNFKNCPINNRPIGPNENIMNYIRNKRYQIATVIILLLNCINQVIQ